jgi:virulence factor Mce-like protein
MDERDKKTELLVGLFLTVGLLLLGLLILQFGSIRELFKGSYTITLPLPDATGIKAGSPVMLGGSRIGKVSKTPDLNATFNGVTILLDIYKDKKIPADAKFALGTSGLLGDTFILIKPSGKAAQTYIETHATIPEENIVKSTGLTDLQETAKEVGGKVEVALEDIRGAVKDLRESLKKLNEGALSDSATKDIKETFRHLNDVVTRIDTKIFGEQTSADIKDAVASLKNAAKSFEDGVKKLDPAFEKVDKASDYLKSTTGKLDKFVDNADAAVKSVDRTAASMRTGSGLLPALMNDPQMKNEMRMLITNLREHGVLWYRDSAGKAAAKKTETQRTSTHPPGTGVKR